MFLRNTGNVLADCHMPEDINSSVPPKPQTSLYFSQATDEECCSERLATSYQTTRRFRCYSMCAFIISFWLFCFLYFSFAFVTFQKFYSEDGGNRFLRNAELRDFTSNKTILLTVSMSYITQKNNNLKNC